MSYHFNNAISYRDTENILQTIDAGDVILDGTTAMHYLLIWMEQTERSQVVRESEYVSDKLYGGTSF